MGYNATLLRNLPAGVLNNSSFKHLKTFTLMSRDKGELHAKLGSARPVCPDDGDKQGFAAVEPGWEAARWPSLVVWLPAGRHDSPAGGAAGRQASQCGGSSSEFFVRQAVRRVARSGGTG